MTQIIYKYGDRRELEAGEIVPDGARLVAAMLMMDSQQRTIHDDTTTAWVEEGQ